MRRSARLAQKQNAKLMNDAQEEPKTKKSRLDNRIADVIALDNNTMVEVFKYLNYCQLAKNSIVSKRFWALIKTHRHTLALLYVDNIGMVRCWNLKPAPIKIFDSELAPEAYNDWVIRNHYSKQVRLKGRAEDYHPQYQLYAYRNYKDLNEERMTTFFACLNEFNRENWPLFQHLVCLLTDPFIYICRVKLVFEEDVYDLLASTIDRSNRRRIQCKNLVFEFEDKSTKFFHWIKDHVRCDNFRTAVLNDSANSKKQLLDFFATGSDCASEILVTQFHISKAVIIDLVQKFTGLKNRDESRFVRSIRGSVSERAAETLSSDYEKFFIKEHKVNRYSRYTTHIFEFVNIDVGKKFQLTITHVANDQTQVTLEIMDL